MLCYSKTHRQVTKETVGNTHGSLLCSVNGTEREGRMTNDRRQKTEAREMVGLIVFGVAHLLSTFVTKHICS